jgi:hypothetical protein
MASQIVYVQSSDVASVLFFAGNMAVVLLAMGGYGSYLGWQIRTSEDGVSVIAVLHCKHFPMQFAVPAVCRAR